VPFARYMQWALHDPEHGAYGSGRLQVGPRGDFATSPSLGSDFAALLAPQLASWLQLLPVQKAPLALIEAGPGEGDLAADLADALVAGWPELAERLQLVLIEPNAGMAARQRQRLAPCPLPVRWSSFAELAAAPVDGVLLAHEVLDALPVERVSWDGAHWRRLGVALHEGGTAGPSLRLDPGEPLQPDADAVLLRQLQLRNLLSQGGERPLDLPPGWTTELHSGVAPWLAAAAAALQRGVLLVVDYALDSRRYNMATRSGGTLLAYRAQQASSELLREPGHWDLTAHLCLESLDADARASGWQPLGQRSQGEALLALGLAQRLHGLQQSRPDHLAAALASREALLRLVDPAGLGAFRWIAFSRGGLPWADAGQWLSEPCLG
jgi:SAM-dependent MidA family methyltransferase